MNHNFLKTELPPYDLLVCDNYLPVTDDDYRTEPLGKNIVREVRKRFRLTDFPILMCSSEPLEEFGYNYSITYDSSVYMNPMFKEVIDDVKNNKAKQLVKRKCN